MGLTRGLCRFGGEGRVFLSSSDGISRNDVAYKIFSYHVGFCKVQISEEGNLQESGAVCARVQEAGGRPCETSSRWKGKRRFLCRA